MDWQGQKSAEMLMQVLLVASAVAAFLVGYAMADFQLMLFVYAGGVVLTALVTVPNWPCFNRHPLKWLETAEADRHPRPHVSSTTAATGDTASRLVRAGYAVYAIYHEGHGRSSGLRCYIPKFSDVVADCSSHFTSVCDKPENREKKRFLYGISMGGSVALLLHRKNPAY